MRLFARRTGAALRFAQTALPDPATPWREAEWCAIDLELTGLHRQDEIIAIGAVPLREGALILGEAMYSLVRPRHPPRRDAILVHKLRSADLERAPSLEEAIDRLLSVLGGRVPVFHTSMVERTFLGRELRRRRLRLPDDADTEVLGRLWLRLRDGVAPAGLPLARLTAALGQPAEDPHHALGDALTTGKAFIALASHLERAGYGTVGALTRVQARPVGRFTPS
ncbi:MAG TPA: 3'-5' exonuclease [Solirubrobacteraceae bacterium]|nr:3'-5' exonuclease [Solirubrobacteraceae bacterium]